MTKRDNNLHLENLRESYIERKRRETRNQVTGFLFLLLLVLVLAVVAWCSSVRAGERAGATAESTAAVPEVAFPEVAFHWSQPREVYAAKIDRFLGWFFASVNPRKLTRARALVPTLLDATEEHGVNPSIVAAMVTLESSWQPAAMGKLGEVGLLQVMRSDAPLDDPRAQLDHGLKILRESYEECGTVVGAISKYATGKSCRPYRGAALRVRMAAKIEGM